MRENKKRWAMRILGCLCIAAYLMLMPPYLERALAGRIHAIQGKQEQGYTGVVSVWHVVGFKPYRGSMTAALSALVKTVEKAHHGVFFDVKGMDVEEYEARLARGETPDMLSFPMGLCYPEQLQPMALELPVASAYANAGVWEGERLACAYSASGYLLLTNVAAIQDSGVTLPEGARDGTWLAEAVALLAEARAQGKKKAPLPLAGDAVAAASLGIVGEVADYEQFRTGKAALAIADLRAASDLAALQTAGKGFAYEASPICGHTFLVQMIGLSRAMEEEKRPYAEELIALLVGERAQKQLMGYGLLPTGEGCAYEAGDDPLLNAAAETLAAPAVPNAFLLQRYRTALEDAAARALAGDAAGKKDFQTRLKELVPSGEIQ